MTSDSSTIIHRLRGRESGQTRYRREGRGEPVILVHGVGMNSTVWGPQVHALAATHDVVAYDMLGHGGSSLPPADAELSDYSDQLRSLFDALGIVQAHVIGHSMGALVALDFAIRNPKQVRSVVALNAVYRRNEEQREAVLARAEVLEGAGNPGLNEDAIRRWFGDPIPTDMTGEADAVRGLLNSVNPTGYARTYRLFARADAALEGRLEQLAVPVLFMTGELDPNSTPAMSRAMAQAAPAGRCEVLAGARHMMALTASGAVTAKLAAFLGAVECEGAGAPAAIDPKAFRQALGAFVTGVTIVSTLQEDGTPRGFTANSFTSVSLDPPLVLVCIAKTAASYPVFAAAGHFAVSVLAEDQKDVSSLFTTKAADKFLRVAWHAAIGGSPVIDGAAAWFACRRHDRVIDAGDHIILLGAVAAFGHSSASPLAYCRGAYLTFRLSQDALAAAGHSMRVGAILERDGALLLVDHGDGSFDLPTGRRLEPEWDPDSLRGVLQRLGLAVTLSFLFAVFDEVRGATPFTAIYYRGNLDRPPTRQAGLRLIPFDEIPWAGVRDEAVRAMLERFVRERREDAFGIYVGGADKGTVQALAQMRAAGRDDPGVKRA